MSRRTSKTSAGGTSRKPLNVANKSERVLAYHLVGFFDVLGQSSRLRHLTRLPETQEEKTDVVRLLKDTAGTVVGLRRLFNMFCTAIDVPTPFVLSRPPEQQRRVD